MKKARIRCLTVAEVLAEIPELSSPLITYGWPWVVKLRDDTVIRVAGPRNFRKKWLQIGTLEDLGVWGVRPKE